MTDARTVELEIRPLRVSDLGAVSEIYASHVGEPPPPSFESQVRSLTQVGGGRGVALAAEGAGEQLVGYVVAEVRAWEFGSPPAGWIFGIGVAPERQGSGVAARLVDAAVRGLQRLGVSTVRTMVKRDDVPVLRLFRGSGFVAGPYTELELELAPDPELDPDGDGEPPGPGS